MRDGQIAVLNALVRAQTFLDANADALGAVNTSTRKQLDDVVKQLSDYSVAQDSADRGSRGETARQRSLRLALRRSYMRPVAKLAQLKLRSVPEFAALTLPPTTIPPQRLVAAAYSMADAASVHAQVFVDNGLPPTFVDDLRNAAVAVATSIAGRGQHQDRRAGATVGLLEEEKRGRIILQVLDALILAHSADNPPLVAGWTSAKMVRQKAGPVSGTPTTAPAPVQSTGAPATVTPAPALVTSPAPA
ncbi:MAG TPA: hypothetical protein VK636_10540, partial [Gemmatimonadaceae bacterium]|nr:hypothetical protein [Gemmatimonadaceae bacterium]